MLIATCNCFRNDHRVWKLLFQIYYNSLGHSSRCNLWKTIVNLFNSSEHSRKLNLKINERDEIYKNLRLKLWKVLKFNIISSEFRETPFLTTAITNLRLGKTEDWFYVLYDLRNRGYWNHRFFIVFRSAFFLPLFVTSKNSLDIISHISQIP